MTTDSAETTPGAAIAASTDPAFVVDLPDASWRPVSPKYVWVQLGSWLIVAVLFAAFATLWLLLWHGVYQAIALYVAAGIAVLNMPFIPRRVRAIGFQLRPDELLFRKGRLFRREVAVPYGRMQLIDVRQGPIARGLGLASLKFLTAAVANDVEIPGLPLAEAESLRDELVALAEQRRAGL